VFDGQGGLVLFVCVLLNIPSSRMCALLAR